MTPEDIHNIRFPRVPIGGYDVHAVDVFMEELENTLEDKQREVSVLRRKMKILVDEIERLRACQISQASQTDPEDDEAWLRNLHKISEPFRTLTCDEKSWICLYCETINQQEYSQCAGCGMKR